MGPLTSSPQNVKWTDTTNWLAPLSAFLISFAILYVIHGFLFRLLARRATATRTQIDDILLGATRVPSHLIHLADPRR